MSGSPSGISQRTLRAAYLGSLSVICLMLAMNRELLASCATIVASGRRLSFADYLTLSTHFLPAVAMLLTALFLLGRPITDGPRLIASMMVAGWTVFSTHFFGNLSI